MTTVVETLLQGIVEWADGRPQVRAIVLVGSYARGAERPESDLDLIILTERPEELLRDLAWTSSLGNVKRHVKEDWGPVTSIRVWYENNLEVEFGVTTLEWASAPDEGTSRVLADGFQVLLDRDAVFASRKQGATPNVETG